MQLIVFAVISVALIALYLHTTDEE